MRMPRLKGCPDCCRHRHGCRCFLSTQVVAIRLLLWQPLLPVLLRLPFQTSFLSNLAIPWLNPTTLFGLATVLQQQVAAFRPPPPPSSKHEPPFFWLEQPVLQMICAISFVVSLQPELLSNRRALPATLSSASPASARSGGRTRGAKSTGVMHRRPWGGRHVGILVLRFIVSLVKYAREIFTATGVGAPQESRKAVGGGPRNTASLDGRSPAN